MMETGTVLSMNDKIHFTYIFMSAGCKVIRNTDSVFFVNFNRNFIEFDNKCMLHPVDQELTC